MLAKQAEPSVKLTSRQKAFLGKLLDVYGEAQEPVHYSTVAERLGLSNSSAYDMLRVLEQKSMVASQYATPKVIAGPGRASILFYPTQQAKQFLSRLVTEISEQEEWEIVKAGILKRLRQVKVTNYRDLLQELLAKAPSAQSPLAQCAEIVTALLLSLKEAKHKMTRQSSVSAIVRAPVSKLRMSILAGLILGLSLADGKVSNLLGNYRKTTEKYEASLQKLNKDGLVALHRFTRDVWNALEAKSTR